MDENSELRGMIYSKYKSKAELARTLRWSHQRLNKALKDPQKQPLENIVKIINALGLQDDPESLKFFMPVNTTKSSK